MNLFVFVCMRKGVYVSLCIVVCGVVCERGGEERINLNIFH